MSKKLIFSLDGVLLEDYGVHVETCTGLIGLPKRKAQLTNDDITSHGKFYDLGALPKYTERAITLNCFISARGRLDFFAQVNTLIGVFDATGLHRLLVSLNSETELPYEVIRVEGAPVEPTWNAFKTIAKFKLQLVEPAPVKRVVITTGGNLTMSFNTDKLVTIGWGDGTYAYDLYGAVNITKQGLPAGTIVVIGGNIEEITGFTITTGGTLQWDIWS